MELRHLSTHDDCARVVELEKQVWGYTDAQDVVPLPLLIVTVKRGGILIGAFEGDQMVGFVYSLPAVRDGKPTQWSHMLGVLDSHRRSGLGRQLKLAQRTRALEMRCDLIEWTYDPLQAGNAHLNFARLGVIVEKYESNLYGESSSPLHTGTPTDRFIAEWWLRSERVERRVASAGTSLVRSPEALEAVPVLRTQKQEGWLRCEAHDLWLEEPALSVEIPFDFSKMQLEHRAAAQEWRLGTRAVFTTYLEKGYRVSEFLLDRELGRGRYLLTRKIV